MKLNMEINTLREMLAELAHSQWAGWTSYMFSKSIRNSDGTLTIPDWAVCRWERQINTHYDDLSEEEKDSDRIEADKVISLFEKYR
jgi:hypothetical protein